MVILLILDIIMNIDYYNREYALTPPPLEIFKYKC